MDQYEKYIHKTLNIKEWKKLKLQAFYKDYSPVSDFEKEYQIQYLHYTSYFKLYSAFMHLKEMKKVSPEGIRMQNSLSNFIQDIFSVCELLAKQIYVTYFDKGLYYKNKQGKTKPKTYLSLHALRNNDNIQKLVKKLPTNRRRKFNRLFIKTSPIKRITNPKNNSWYNDLKYYRNNLIHGILAFRGKNSSGEISLLEREKFENNFEFIIKNIPVHNKSPSKRTKQKLINMLRDDSIIKQCQNYFDKVVELCRIVWDEILDFYLNSPKKPGVKA